MADRDFDREPRYRNTGYWTDRDEDDQRPSEGDRSKARNYNREDQRRYGRQSVEQGERLERLRGQTPRPDQAARRGQPMRDQDRNKDMPREQRYGRNWDEDMDAGRSGRGRQEGQNRSQNRDRMGVYRDQQSSDRPIRSWERDWEYVSRYHRREDADRGQDNPRRRAQNDPYYDYERDYRTVNRGRNLNMEGNPDYGEDEQRGRNRDNEGDFWSYQEPDRDVDQMDNYWGRREQGRQYGDRPRPGFTSARNPNPTSDRGGGGGEGSEFEERSYDMDPGFSYEFGTDFNFMRDADRDEIRRRQFEQQDQRDFNPDNPDDYNWRENRRRDVPQYSSEQQRRGRQMREEQLRRAEERRREIEMRDQWGSLGSGEEEQPNQNRSRRQDEQYEEGRRRQYEKMRQAEARPVQPRDAQRQQFNPGDAGRYQDQGPRGSGDQRLGRTSNEAPGWRTTEEQRRDRQYRSESGPYAGMGPTYKRSDERITDEINERLTRHGQIDSRKIQVEVKAGEVTLSGTVNSKNEKRLAEVIIEDISGVQDINNRIRVER